MKDDAPPIDPSPPACRRCKQPLDAVAAKVRTCAACEARYHEDCARGHQGCAVLGCALERPSHPAWTREVRDRGGVWLPIPAPAASPWLARGILVACMLIAAYPAPAEVAPFVKRLIGAGQIAPWMAISVTVGLKLAPWAVLLTLLALQQATTRSVLVDSDGVLFDHSPTWYGARLRWDQLVGFRLIEGGVRLVVHGRPWTRWLGPTIPAEGAAQHDLSVILEKLGDVRRYDA